ncbi:MAG TPA: hypothetical protein VMY36_00015 [Patescibacteria group bacterium]|nr:hypothetical protein [Patescibacteria group bacterium]
MTRFEKLMATLIITFIIAVLTNCVVLKKHMNELRRVENAIEKASTRPIKIEYKMIE